MPDIFIAAIITTALAALVIEFIVFVRAPKKLRPGLWLAVLAYIPIYWAPPRRRTRG